MPSPGSLFLFCTAQQQDTFVATAYDQSYTFAQPIFRQPDGDNCVVRRVYLAIIANLSQSKTE